MAEGLGTTMALMHTPSAAKLCLGIPKRNAFFAREDKMASVRETIDALYFAYDESLISDEEFIVLHYEILKNDFKQSNYPYTDYEFFNWETYDPLTCKIELRFEKEDIPHLQQALQIPESVEFYRSSYCSGLEALCILLRRLAFPIRYCDMVPRFGRSVPDLCKITHVVINHNFEVHRYRLQNWNHPWLQPYKLAEYAMVINDKGAPLSNCFGFIDGTVRPICRPGETHRMVYHGHKRIRGIKFQSVVFPNGLIGNLSGPYGELLLKLLWTTVNNLPNILGDVLLSKTEFLH